MPQLELSRNHDGAVSHWLACGPVLSPLYHLDDIIDPSGSPFGPGKRWIFRIGSFTRRVRPGYAARGGVRRSTPIHFAGRSCFEAAL